MRRIIAVILIILCISIPTVNLVNFNIQSQIKLKNTNKMNQLTIWQIDSFEGAKGSRAEVLKAVGNEIEHLYTKVLTMTYESALINLERGLKPDLISYGVICTQLKDYVEEEFTWCYGMYCYLTLDENADFTDVRAENVVVNMGKDHLTEVVACLEGVADADYGDCLSAYISLIKGEYKYLLGTQRDIQRLITRGETFKVREISSYNDLYQNIAVVKKDKYNNDLINQYIKVLMSDQIHRRKLSLLNDANNVDGQYFISKDSNVEYKIRNLLTIEKLQGLKEQAKINNKKELKKLLDMC